MIACSTGSLGTLILLFVGITLFFLIISTAVITTYLFNQAVKRGRK